MSRKKTILINIVSNTVFLVFQILTGFVLVPLLIGFFSKELFGAFVYVCSLVIILDVFSHPLTTSLVRYVPEMKAKEENRELHEIIYTLLWVSIPLHFCLAVGTYFLSFWGNVWFNVPLHLHETITSVIQLIAFSTLFKFTYPLINGVLHGLQRWHLYNKTSLLLTLVQVIAYLVVTKASLGLWEYVLIQQLGEFLVYMFRLFLCWKILPIKKEWLKRNWTRLKSLRSFQINLLFIQISDHFNYTFDKLILQRYIGSFAVAEYHIARRMAEICNAFAVMPLRTVLPALSDAFAQGDTEFIKKTNTLGTLLFGFVVIPPLIALFCLFPFFVELWVGPDFQNTVPVGRLFLLGVICLCPFSIVGHSLMSKGRVELISRSKLIYSGINFVLSCLLVTQIGIVGVVIPTAIYYTLVYPMVILHLLKKEAFLDGKELLRGICPFAWSFILFHISHHFVAPPITSWLSLIAYILLYSLSCICLTYLFISPIHKKRLKEQLLLFLPRLKSTLAK